MITWNEFAEFALPSVLLWMAGAIAAWKGRPYASVLLTVAGLCVYAAFIAVFWTGLHSLLSGQWTMTGKSSLLMFPIYGCASIIAPLYARISSLSFVCRGLLYMLGFYMVEFISGSFLREIGICPWDYSAARFQYRGIIRLDYAPLWFAAGLIFEKILTKSA